MPPLSRLEQLPQELHICIADYLNDRDVSDLSRASRHLSRALTGYLYHRNAAFNDTPEFRRFSLDWAARYDRPAVFHAATAAGLRISDYPFLLVLSVFSGSDSVTDLLLKSGEIPIDSTGRDETWTALAWAVSLGNRELAKRLVDDYGANVNHVTSEIETVLVIAIIAHEENLAGWLLNKGAKPNGVVNQDQYPLEIACSKGLHRAAKLLLEHGADPMGGSALYPIHAAASEGHTEIIKLLLSYGVKVDACARGTSRTPLLLAVLEGHAPAAQFLLENGADQNTHDGNPMLDYSCTLGNAEIANLLLQHGAVIGERGAGHPLLCEAVRFDRDDVVKVLLAHGANVNLKNVTGRSPLYLACEARCAEVVAVLLEAGADTESADFDGYTPLHKAIEASCREAVDLLLNKGANTMARQQFGATAFHMAAASGSYYMMQKIMKAAATDVNALDNNKRSAFFHAARENDVRIMTIIMSRGDWIDWQTIDQLDRQLDVRGNVNDAFGTPPIIAAAKNGHKEAVELIVKVDPEAYKAIDADGRDIFYWAGRSGISGLRLFLTDLAHSHDLGMRTMLAEDRDAKYRFETDVCWCDRCTLCSVHDTHSFKCLICDGGEFVICGDCVESGRFCLDESHPREAYVCGGSTVA